MCSTSGKLDKTGSYKTGLVGDVAEQRLKIAVLEIGEVALQIGEILADALRQLQILVDIDGFSCK